MKNNNNEGARMVEFGKLELGNKFYLGNPEALTENAAYTKIVSQKNNEGAWANAKNSFGLVTFVQYDKRVWKK